LWYTIITKKRKGDLKMSFEEMYDLLREGLDVSEEALDLAFAIGGCNEETAERILFFYTGWQSFEGWLDEIGED
jgi:hypothetical protein